MIAPVSAPVPYTVFNEPLTKRRAVAFASIPLADVKDGQRRVRGQHHQRVFAACTLSLRAWLERHDEVPDGAADADAVRVAGHGSRLALARR